MKTAIRITTMCLSAYLINMAHAQCPSQNTVFVVKGVSKAYQLADAGKLCAGHPVVMAFPGSQRSIVMCVFTDTPLKLSLAVIDDPILGTPKWGNYIPPATAVIGGISQEQDGQCFVVPEAITYLRVVTPEDTNANVSVSVGF